MSISQWLSTRNSWARKGPTWTCPIHIQYSNFLQKTFISVAEFIHEMHHKVMNIKAKNYNIYNVTIKQGHRNLM